MEITIKMNDIKMSIHHEYEDVTIERAFEMFNALLLGVTYSQETINNQIKKLAETL